MHDEVLPYSICVPSLVLVAQVVFLLERGHIHRHTKPQMPLITLLMHQLLPAGVGNYTSKHCMLTASL